LQNQARDAAGDPDRMASFDSGDLPDYRPDGARSRRDDDSFPRFRLTDFEKTDIGGHPRHAEDAERRRDRRRCGIELAQPGAIRKRVFLPAAIAEHDVADRVFRIARLDDLANRAADHRLPDVNRLCIRFRGTHAAAHVWVEREIENAHEHLPLAGRWRRSFCQLEIIEAGCAFRSALQ
jgi:hypothetical protein